MMHSKTILAAAIITVAFHAASFCAEPVARTGVVEGNASLLSVGTEKWRPARPNMPLKIGDQLFCRAESFVEISYATGAIVRLDENTKIIISSASGNSVRTENPLGQVWVNMKKIAQKDVSFEMASPTAVAAIRGTVFHMQTGADSSTDVSVFDGKVAVGPSDALKKKQAADTQKSQVTTPVEVPGPSEIPGPFEVTLEQWKTIVAGQRISVRSNGKFAQDKFDMENAGAENSFIKKNLEMDGKQAQE